MTDDQMIGEAALHAFLDNELDAEANQQVQYWLQHNPEHLHELEIWQQQKKQLKATYDPILKERIPKNLQKTLNQATKRKSNFSWQSLAASIMLLTIGGVSGWFLNDYTLRNGSMFNGKQVAMKNDGIAMKVKKKWPSFAFAAISSHIVFSQDLTRPVEFASPQKNYLLAWIKHRTGQELTPPDLSSSGFKLLGGRVIPFEEKPAALFMYEDVQGTRVTLFIGQNKEIQNSSKRFWSKKGVNCFFWNKGKLNFAITSTEGQEKLDAMSKQVLSHFTNI